MKVTAIKRGFIHGLLRQVGDKFECSEEEFSKVWMTEGDFKKPDPIDNSGVKKSEDVVYESLELPELDNKPKLKRKRRTPAEMAAARAEEAKQEK